jgi:hypothetical protein
LANTGGEQPIDLPFGCQPVVELMTGSEATPLRQEIGRIADHRQTLLGLD